MKKKLFIILSAILLSILIWKLFNFKNSPSSQNNVRDPIVIIDQVKIEKISLYTELPARVTAYKIAEIRPQTNGIIIKRNFTEGSEVKENEQLYQIDLSNYTANYVSAQAELQKSEAAFNSIKSQYKRYEELVKISAVSKQEFEDLGASLKQSEADISIKKAGLDKAIIDLNYTKVLAPISGKISKSYVSQGALVTANQSQILATITQLDPIYVDMNQSSSEFMKIRDKIDSTENIEVEIFINDTKKIYPLKGRLLFSETILDQTTSSIQMRAIFDNPEKILIPGLFVKAKIKFQEEEFRVIPQKAISYDINGNAIVWVVDKNNITSPRVIKTSQTVNNKAIIEDGLEINDNIVIEGFQKIKPEIKVVPSLVSK